MIEIDEKKLMAVLEFYLSLHEADATYNLLIDPGVDPAHVVKYLAYCRDANKLPWD